MSFIPPHDDTPELLSLLYFSSPACSVCHALLPKVRQLISAHFPALTLEQIAIDQQPERAAAHHVFSAPTIILMYGQQEQWRLSGVFSLLDLQGQIERPYLMLLGD